MEIIHIVLGKVNPNRMNGVNKVVYQMATQQQKFGNKVSVWGMVADLTINYDDRNFETRLFLKSKWFFRIPFGLEDALKKQNPDTVFHLHGGWIPLFYWISKLLTQYNFRFVFTPHGAYNEIAMQKNSFVKKIYFSLFEKKLLQRTTKIHCIGKSEIEGLHKIFTTQKIFLMPYGFEYETELKPKNFSEKTIFGFVGRLDIYTKGLDVLTKSFATFSAKNPDVELWIIGDSNQKNELAQQIEQHNATEKIKLLGSKFGTEKNELMQQIKIFAHPSRNEGMPTAVLEATNFAIPCLVTEATNIGDLIAKYQAGVVIQNLNEIDLTNALQTIYDQSQNPETYQKMASNAKKMVAENFDWQIIINNYNQQLYGISNN